jgi:hypothetical protein
MLREVEWVEEVEGVEGVETNISSTSSTPSTSSTRVVDYSNSIVNNPPKMCTDMFIPCDY